MSTLYKRGPVYYVGVPTRSGGWVKKSTGTHVRAQAIRIQAMLRDLGPTGQRAWDFLDAIRDGQLTIGALFDAYSVGPHGIDELRTQMTDSDANDAIPGWLKSIRDNVAPDTIQHYATHVRTLIPAGIRYPVSQIHRVTIAKWLQNLECTTSTKRKYRAALSSFCNYLVEMGIIAINPVNQVKAPKPGKFRMRHLEHFDVIRLIEMQPEPFRTISALMHGTGMEISAVLRVTRGDLDTKTWMIRAQGTKTASRDRQAYVTGWVRPYLERHVAGMLPGAPLFPGVTRWAPAKAHKRACDALGITDYTLRDSRHTFAVAAVKAGVPLQLIAHQLGHADTQMVVRCYGRYQPGQAEMAQMFDRAELRDNQSGAA